MFGEDLRQTGAEAVIELIPEIRARARSRADGVPVIEQWHAARADVIGIVYAGNPEFYADVLSVVRPGRILVHSVIAEVAVEQERRAERPGVAGADHIDLGFADAALVETQNESVHDVGLKHGELAPDRVLLRALPGDLRVVVGAIHLDFAPLHV